MSPDNARQSAAGRPKHVASLIERGDATEALKNGPVGAFIVSAVAVALLFLGWMAFYFLLFIPRGPIG